MESDTTKEINGGNRSAPIDAEMLRKRCFGNLEFAESLLRKLVSTGCQRVEEIQQLADREDAMAMAEAAHALKGAASILCATTVQELASQIEQAGRSSDPQIVQTLLSDLAAEMQRCLDYMPALHRELTVLKEQA